MGNWWIVVLGGSFFGGALVGIVLGYFGGLELGFRVGRRRGERERELLVYEREQQWERVRRKLDEHYGKLLYRDRRDGR